MQPTDAPDSGQPLKKTWHAPQCTKKSWQTPQFVAIPFGQTRGGDIMSLTENNSGTLATAS